MWSAVGVVALGFLIALEVAARHYGEPGPLTNQVREIAFPPKSGFLLYAGMGLMMVVLTWRERLIALGAALGIDLAVLAVRWATGTLPVLGGDEGHPFGNGALCVVLGARSSPSPAAQEPNASCSSRASVWRCSWWPGARPVTPGC